MAETARALGTRVIRLGAGGDAAPPEGDLVAVERPLVVELEHGPAGRRRRLPVATTLRTPGNDAELALGGLLALRAVRAAADVARALQVGPDLLRVELAPDVPVDERGLARLGPATAACGACGRATLEEAFALDAADRIDPASGPRLARADLLALPARLAGRQPGFRHTGGLHAAALVAADGTIEHAREDVGRHNAIDKVLGAAAAADTWPLDGRFLVVTSRAGAELVDKAIRAGAAGLLAMGAATSLAAELAEASGRTLVGFLRADRATIYAGAARIRTDDEEVGA